MLKNQVNQQFARVAEADGTRSYTQFPDNGTEPLADDQGRLLVRVVDGGGFVDAYTQIPAAAAQVTDQFTVSAAPCALGELHIYSMETAPRYVQLHDAAAPIIAGAVPAFQISVQERALLSFTMPYVFAAGLVVALSTLERTFSAGGDFALAGRFRT